MTIKLYLMRHGDAVMHASSDAARSLSSIGKAQVARAADHLRASAPDVFWASPYLRAQETAQIIKQEAGIDTGIVTQSGITPDDNPRQVVSMLTHLEAQERILMISHNPLVTALVNLLVEGQFHGPHGMATASIALIEFEVIETGLGELQWIKHTN